MDADRIAGFPEVLQPLSRFLTAVSRRMFFSKTFTLHPDRIYQFYQL